jgi:ubiquinone biosynthesis protein COQ9
LSDHRHHDNPLRADHLLAEKRAILAAALPDIPFDGWTEATLIGAAKAAGFDRTMALRAFPGGAIELLDFHVAEVDRAMLEALGERDLTGLKLREKIALAIRLRLESEAGHREAIRKAIGMLALPHRAPLALRQLHRTVDAIWHAVGDTSTDFSWYTKRFLLAGVYSATLLHWIDDRSPNQEASWGFLDRRLGDVMRIQGARGRLDKFAGRLPDPFRALRRMRGA